jgi:hypothetical protein
MNPRTADGNPELDVKVNIEEPVMLPARWRFSHA